jgi:hypothetical protein
MSHINKSHWPLAQNTGFPIFKKGEFERHQFSGGFSKGKKFFLFNTDVKGLMIFDSRFMEHNYRYDFGSQTLLHASYSKQKCSN